MPSPAAEKLVGSGDRINSVVSNRPIGEAALLQQAAAGIEGVKVEILQTAGQQYMLPGTENLRSFAGQTVPPRTVPEGQARVRIITKLGDTKTDYAFWRAYNELNGNQPPGH